MIHPALSIPNDSLQQLCRHYHVRRLAVFGSAVTGGFTPDSDVDLLVEFEEDAAIGFLAFNRMKRELSGLLHRPVDLVPHAGLKSAIRDQVLSSAEILYEA